MEVQIFSCKLCGRRVTWSKSIYASSMSFALHLYNQHPDIMDTRLEEVMAIVNNNQLSPRDNEQNIIGEYFCYVETKVF